MTGKLKSYTVLSFLTMFSYRELPFFTAFCIPLLRSRRIVVRASVQGIFRIDASLAVTDHRIIEEIKRTAAVGHIGVIPAEMHDLIVSPYANGPVIIFDEQVPVHISVIIVLVCRDHGVVFPIVQRYLPAAALDPVIPNDRAGRPVFQAVAIGAVFQRPIPVELVGDANGGTV